MKSKFLIYFPTAVGIAAAVIYASISLLGWIIDDAAISLSYGINLFKYGELIAQPNSEPTEGYSNPLWVIILGITSLTDLSLELQIRTISLAIVCFAAYRLHSSFKEYQYLISFSLLMLFLQPSVVIWCISGLENPLYLYFSIELFILLAKITAHNNQNDAINAGLILSALALTRPDGILFFPLYILTISLKRPKTKELLYRISTYTLTVCLIYGGYLIFRYYYFGSLFPNTYLAKGGPSTRDLLALITLEPNFIFRVTELSISLFSYTLQSWGVIATLILVSHALKKPTDGIFYSALLITIISLLIYLLLPSDWMGEARFATTFFVGFYLLLASSIFKVFSGTQRHIMVSIILLLFALQYFQRIHEFSTSPPISIKEVQDRGHKITQWADILELDTTSVLTADIGGLLLMDRLIVLDLGMLTNKSIAEFLGEQSTNKSLSKFHDYIFIQEKPHFIELRAYHSWLANLESDERFKESYVSIVSYEDQWILNRYKESRLSGDFIRRDLLEDNEAALSRIKEIAEKHYYPFCLSCFNAP